MIFASAYMSKNYEKMTTFKGILPVLISGGIICVLIILEPNMSITMCVAIVMFCMLFIDLQKHVETLSARLILADEAAPGCTILIDKGENGLTARVSEGMK